MKKRPGAPLPDTVRARKISDTPIASDKGAPDKSTKTSNRNLAQGQQTNTVRTTTSYFYPVWNVFSHHTDGSKKWIPKQNEVIGEDFHSQVGDGKVRLLSDFSLFDL